MRRPILFSGEMVRAILDGKKTQTRRVIKPQPIINEFGGCWYPTGLPGDSKSKIRAHYSNENHLRKGMPIDFSPYGHPGDTLWVREAFAYGPSTHPIQRHVIYKADWDDGAAQEIIYFPTGETEPLIWRPSIHMPAWATRILLQIVDIHIERLQDISLRDLLAEGIEDTYLAYRGAGSNEMKFLATEQFRTKFEILWNSINAKRGYGWDTNPFVWVIEFELMSSMVL